MPCISFAYFYTYETCVSVHITVDPIWMDDVRCLRGEEVLDECSFRGWGLHNCHHEDDVGVVCVPGEDPTELFGIATIGWFQLQVSKKCKL